MQLYRILSCDGGGIRGLLTAILLEHLENQLQRQYNRPESTLRDYFDLFAGTSTGSIIACAVAQGIKASDIRHFFEYNSQEIFPDLNSLKYLIQGGINRVIKHDISLPLFKADGLEKVLKLPEIFPENLLFGSLPKPTLISSYDTYNREAVFFKSTESQFKTIPIWQICCASAAAPIVFPAYLLSNPDFLENIRNKECGEGDIRPKIPAPENAIPLIDGGVVANNPVLCAIAEAINIYRKNNQILELSKIMVASFGTGQSKRRINPESAQTWGALDWTDIFKGIPLMDVFSDGASDAFDHIAKTMLDGNYFRYQPTLDPNTATFQANPENLNLLKSTAENYLQEGGSQKLNNLVEKLHPSTG